MIYIFDFRNILIHYFFFLLKLPLLDTLNWLIYNIVLVLLLLLLILLFIDKTILAIIILAVLRRQVLILDFLTVRQVLIVRQSLLNKIVLHLVISSELIDWAGNVAVVVAALRQNILGNLFYWNRTTTARILFIVLDACYSSF